MVTHMKTRSVKLADITADQLNGNCLRTMCQCALKLRVNYGVVLELSHRKALPRLRKEIKKTNDGQLMALYKDLKVFLGESLREHGVIEAS